MLFWDRTRLFQREIKNEGRSFISVKSRFPFYYGLLTYFKLFQFKFYTTRHAVLSNIQMIFHKNQFKKNGMRAEFNQSTLQFFASSEVDIFDSRRGNVLATEQF